MGKSAFVLNIATYVAQKQKIPVLIFNLEMGKDQLTDRIICSETLINSRNYRNGKVDENDWAKLVDKLGDLADTPIFIDDNSSITISEISRSLKILAKELNIPVIALSQLSRANEKRNSKDKRPVLSDLRDSGNIEQDADIVLFIHREDYYNNQTENRNIAEIIFAKHRSGEPRNGRIIMARNIY